MSYLMHSAEVYCALDTLDILHQQLTGGLTFTVQSDVSRV